MQDETTPGFHGPAEMHPYLLGQAGRLDAQLAQQVGEGYGADQAVDDQPHGAILVVCTHVDDGAGETSIAQSGHGDQQLTGQIALIGFMA